MLKKQQLAVALRAVLGVTIICNKIQIEEHRKNPEDTDIVLKTIAVAKWQ